MIALCQYSVHDKLLLYVVQGDPASLRQLCLVFSPFLCLLNVLYQIFATLICLFWLIVRSAVNIFFYQLQTIPGPFLAKLYRAWFLYLEAKGNPHNNILDQYCIHR